MAVDVVSGKGMLGLAIAIAFVVGCAGAPPVNQGGGDDDDDGGGTTPIGQRVSGKTLDYFGGGVVASSAITTDGIDPVIDATSAADGTWSINGVPLGAEIYLSTAHAGYRTTRNGAFAIAADLDQDIFAVGEADIVDQYTAASATPVDGTAVLIVELRDDRGMALEGIPLANIKLLDSTGTTIANTQALFFNATEVDPALTAATAFDGRSRVAIMDVPAGTYTLKVNFTTPNNMPITNTTRIKAAANGAIVAISKP
jgi:hypothetical protein